MKEDYYSNDVEGAAEYERLRSEVDDYDADFDADYDEAFDPFELDPRDDVDEDYCYDEDL
jgi:hypothetical protein